MSDALYLKQHLEAQAKYPSGVKYVNKQHVANSIQTINRVTGQPRALGTLKIIGRDPKNKKYYSLNDYDVAWLAMQQMGGGVPVILSLEGTRLMQLNVFDLQAHNGFFLLEDKGSVTHTENNLVDLLTKEIPKCPS